MDFHLVGHIATTLLNKSTSYYARSFEARLSKVYLKVVTLISFTRSLESILLSSIGILDLVCSLVATLFDQSASVLSETFHALMSVVYESLMTLT